MNGEQKLSWFLLGVVWLSCTKFLVLDLTFGLRPAFAAVSIMALGAFTPLIARGDKLDERDRSIARRAKVVGGVASYLAFVFGCMGIWFVEFKWHGQEQVAVHLCPAIVVLGGVTLITARSLAVLHFLTNACDLVLLNNYNSSL